MPAEVVHEKAQRENNSGLYPDLFIVKALFIHLMSLESEHNAPSQQHHIHTRGLLLEKGRI